MSEDERLRSYLEAVDRLPRLTDAEVHDLAGAIEPQDEAGDLAAGAEHAVARRDAARKRLIEGNLRTVVVIAEQYRRQGLSLGALVEAGNLGLVRAVQDFDWRWPSGFPRHATAATTMPSPLLSVAASNAALRWKGGAGAPVTVVSPPGRRAAGGRPQGRP